MSVLRQVARKGALDVLSVGYRASRRERDGLTRPRVHLPYLHAVSPDQEDRFRAFVRALAKDHTFISYSEAVQRVLTGEIDRPYVSFSFDDGFASNVRAGGILEEFGAVGMFFVPAGFIGVETVAGAREFFGFDKGCDEPAMTWDDLESLKAHGHEIGNHSWSHRIMSTLSPQEQYDEIAATAEELRSRLGESVHFAWPYGRFSHFAEHAARAVFDTGHTSCASAERGAHTLEAGPDPRTLCLRRDHVMTEWPQRHSRYFIAHSGRHAGAEDNLWPRDWSIQK